VKSGITADQRGKFGTLIGPHPTIAAQPHGLVRGEVGDRVSKGPIHVGTKIEHLADRCQAVGNRAWTVH
jgi:hypothetical protein